MSDDRFVMNNFPPFIAMTDEIVQKKAENIRIRDAVDHLNHILPILREPNAAERILAALREPSEAVVEAACLALYGAHNWAHSDPGDTEWRADARQRFIRQLSAAVAAAEREVGGE